MATRAVPNWPPACRPLPPDRLSNHSPSASHSSLTPLRSFDPFPSPSPFVPPPLVDCLFPVRLLLHGLLSDVDAARLLRVSRSSAFALLPGYAFTQHVFQPQDLDQLHRITALYARYGLRVTRLCLPFHFRRLSFDPFTGRSPLPDSLTTLLLGSLPTTETGAVHTQWSIFGPTDWARPTLGGPWLNPLTQQSADHYRQFVVEAAPWELLRFEKVDGLLCCPLPPGLIPPGVRRLQYADEYNCALVRGSIPSTVTFLQLGARFNQPVRAGVLPDLLTHLVFGIFFDQLLSPGNLPPHLQCLDLGRGRWNQPLPAGTLPASIRILSFSRDFDQPLVVGALPPCLTHLRLSAAFTQPIGGGVLPAGLVHLDLGGSYDEPLLPGVLPSSLRELLLSPCFHQPLPVGALPRGLLFLRFRGQGYSHPLVRHALSSSLIALVLGSMDAEAIMASAFPPELRYLGLPQAAREQLRELHLPIGTEVCWC